MTMKIALRFYFLIAALSILATGALWSCSDDDDDTTIAVTGVTLNKTTLSLTDGSSETLTATISPSNATHQTVTWHSNNTSVATVNAGAVTAEGEGSTTVTVTTDDGSFTASCTVTVTESSSAGAYTQTSGTVTVSDKTYTSSTSDENAVKVSGGTFTMNSCTITKTGDTGNSDNSSFYGTNAAILASSSGVINMVGGTITTNSIGSNGIVAYGGTVTVSDATITCSKNLSRGIHATGGGTITASNLTINTAGSNSSVIALDKGGGIVNVTGGTYNATGVDCAVMYSTGNLTVNNITGSSAQGEVGVIEGDNYITINNSTITSGAGSSSRGLMILQSGSGDAGTGINGVITVTGGSLTMTGASTPFIEIVTNVNGQVTLDGVSTTIPSGILMKVDYNTRWSTNGATGTLILSGSGTTYTGSIVADSYSSAVVTVNSGVTLSGAYDNANTAKSTSITVNGGTWSLTGDSYVDTITLTNNATINKNGHTLTYTTLNNTSGTINN
ncbi:hypothetical protein CYCD_22180 [Tenuifilaceae bacterium CYCD]|nr:hypothetical protein CYCD_22180 [Tenuifilaceae bacterium CYCD]